MIVKVHMTAEEVQQYHADPDFRTGVGHMIFGFNTGFDEVAPHVQIVGPDGEVVDELDPVENEE